jgi:hypothetical protein
LNQVDRSFRAATSELTAKKCWPQKGDRTCRLFLGVGSLSVLLAGAVLATTCLVGHAQTAAALPLLAAEPATEQSSCEANQNSAAKLDKSPQISKITVIPEDYQKYMVMPWDLLKIPKFKRTYEKILSESKENRDWVKTLNVVSNRNDKFYRTNEGDYFIYEGFRQRTNFYIKIVFNSKIGNMTYRIEDYSELGSSYEYYGNSTVVNKFLLDKPK